MEDQKNDHKLSAILLTAGGVVLFSAKAVFVKMAYKYDVDTISLLLIRLMIALPIYFAIVAFSFKKWKRKYSMKPIHIIPIVALGFLGYYFASYLDFAGLHYVSASMERLILFVYPTMVVGLTAVLFRRRIPEKQWIAILITYFGIFLIFFQDIVVENQSSFMLGGSLIIACAFFYACFMVGSEQLIPNVGPMQFTCYALIVSGLAVLLHYTISKKTGITSFETEVYWIGGAMAIFSTVIPSFMIAEGIKRLGASQVAIIGSVGPISTILLAAILLGERVTAFQGLGAIIVISGVMLVNSASDKIFPKPKIEEQPEEVV